MRTKEFFKRVLSSISVDPKRLVDIVLNSFADLLVRFSNWLNKFTSFIAWWLRAIVEEMHNETNGRIRDNGWRIGGIHLSQSRNHMPPTQSN